MTDDTVVWTKSLHSHRSTESMTHRHLDTMALQQFVRIHERVFCVKMTSTLKLQNNDWKEEEIINYPKHRNITPFNQTKNRNSAASPGFTAGFAVPT